MRQNKWKQLVSLMIITGSSLQGYAQKALADSLVSKEILQQHVQALAHDSMQGRRTGTSGCEKAAAYIAREMKTIGLKTFDRSDSNYYHHYSISGASGLTKTMNVVGLIPGKRSGKCIIFSAHYDHVGDANDIILPTQLNSSRTDKIYNGANDNASGVAVMLSLAAYFALLQDNDYCIIFVAFSGEEAGLLGSFALAKSFKNTDSIIQVINMDMLGRASAKSSRPFITEGINSYGFTKKLNKNLKQTDPHVQKNFFITDYLPGQNYFERSDNYPFALKGVPANTIMSGNDYDRYYHSPGDEWQTLDYELMANTAKAIALATIPMLKIVEEKKKKKHPGQ